PLPAELARLLHDPRGPLNSAVIHLEVLKRTVADDPAAAESLRTVLHQLGRLSEMLPAALGVAALEPDPPRTLDLRALVERACEAGGHAGVTVTAGAWPCVRGDEALLVRAIGELIANGVQATRAGGRRREAARGQRGVGQGRAESGGARAWVCRQRGVGSRAPARTPRSPPRLGGSAGRRRLGAG